MRLKFAAPFIDNRHGRNRRGIAQRAESPAKHVLRQVLYACEVLAQAAAVVEARKRLFEPVSTLAAWNAPAATFVLVELHHAEGKLDHAGGVVKDHDAAGAKELTALAERIEIHV